MEAIATIISQVGFPIAAFLLMFWMCKDQIAKMEDTVNKNTEAITKLVTYMESKERRDIDGK